MKVEVGDKAIKSFKIKDEMVVQFAEVTGDKNPIHLSDEYASKTPFKKRIAHGMLLGGFVSNLLANDLPGEGTIYLNQQLNFLSPVYLGEEVVVALEIVSVREDKPIATIKTTCFVKDKLVMDGIAVVKFSY